MAPISTAGHLPAPTAVTEHEHTLVVAQREQASDDVLALTLAAPDGSPLTPWAAGAHIDLILPTPTGELVRQYSLCSSPGDLTSYRLGILHEPAGRGGSAYIHDGLRVGDTVRVAGPRNHFELVEAASYVLIAGGIGVTPLLPMVAALAASGADWHLYYVGRSRSTMAFCGELEQYADHVTLVPRDVAPRPDLAALLATPVPGRVVYSCGPESLIGWLEQTMAANGWAPGALHTERFEAQEIDTSGDQPFEVELSRTGKSLLVPADSSIFQVAREAGVSVLGSCLEGICGTCETEILEADGELIHRDSVLTLDDQASGEVMMICVSRCTGKVVLDM